MRSRAAWCRGRVLGRRRPGRKRVAPPSADVDRLVPAAKASSAEVPIALGPGYRVLAVPQRWQGALFVALGLYFLRLKH